MSNRRNKFTVFIKTDTEEQMQAQLLELGLETLKDIEVISIYPRGSKVVAWVKVERQYVEVKAAPEKVIKKKTTKKKVVRK